MKTLLGLLILLLLGLDENTYAFTSIVQVVKASNSEIIIQGSDGKQYRLTPSDINCGTLRKKTGPRKQKRALFVYDGPATASEPFAFSTAKGDGAALFA